VTLVPKAVSSVTSTGVVDVDGVEHPVDVLVMANLYGDVAARQRAETFLRDAFAAGEVGNIDGGAAQQFAITPTNVVNLNYPQNRPDLYVDQLDYQYPLYAAVNKGTLDAVTPFVIPKFNASSGLVADHVTGTEPTPGAFTATAQTITPSAVSGKVEITREAFDQGGNPQMSGLIWKQMVRGWYEALEAYVQAQLVANAASITDITLTTAATDSTLDGLLADAIVPLQYIRGGDRRNRAEVGEPDPAVDVLAEVNDEDAVLR